MLLKNLFRHWTYQVFSPGTVLREKYESFKSLLEHDKAAHEFMAALEDIYYTRKQCDFQAVVETYEQFAAAVSSMVEELLIMSPSGYWNLKDYFKKFDFYIRFMLAPPKFNFSPPFTVEFDKIPVLDEAVTGKKAFSLSCLNKDLCLPTPKGFVVTTNAFHYFMETSNLRDPINKKLAQLDIHDSSSLKTAAHEIKLLILNAVLPKEIAMEINNAMDNLEINNGNHSGKNNPRVALRSSAVKEDGRISFAGVYQTILNVNKTDISKGYKQVIASKYSAQALFYRISHGILDHETPMAVLVLEMINSKSSGVIYTRDIGNHLSQNLLIHSIWGQGGLLVEGEVSPDVIRVSKKDPVHIISVKTAVKPKQMVLSPEIQTRTIDTDKDKKSLISIDKPSALTLAKWGIALETHFNEPQDIEWCQDRAGKLFILQSRPLNIHPAPEKSRERQIKPMHGENGDPQGRDRCGSSKKVICSGGETVCPGTGHGPVYIIKQVSQINHLPAGSVVVVNHALPQFVTAINKMSAIIIASGSQASHFSSIAREFGIPAIVNISKGFNDLIQGMVVTVDADKCIVYKGKTKLAQAAAEQGANHFKKSSFMVKLRYVINFCARLKLTDPGSDSFTPESCRSLHDIIRFTHETALKEMFLIGNRKGGRKKGAKKLISSIPMLFYVLDVGQGIRGGQQNKTPENNKSRKNVLKAEDIASVPMKAVLKGLSNPGICWSETTHFDWEEYDKIVLAGGIISADSSMFGSYAVLSKDYLNVNFRFGYHFVILDTICSASKKDNYILFRFSGGGGTPSGRSLRANFIKEILIRLGFMVQIKSDLVDAQFRHGSLKSMEKTLDMVGRLLGATKLMDMYLKDNMELKYLIDEFMDGQYDFRPAVDKDHK